jgi:hypothetical protein
MIPSCIKDYSKTKKKQNVWYWKRKTV